MEWRNSRLNNEYTKNENENDEDEDEIIFCGRYTVWAVVEAAKFEIIRQSHITQ